MSVTLPSGERVDETGDRRIGGHRSEHTRLGPQYADVGHAVAAERDSQGHIQQGFAWVMHRSRLAPRRQCRRYRSVSPTRGPSRPTAPARPARPPRGRRRRHGHAGTTRYASSPGGASFLAADRTLDKSHRCRSAALSTYLIKPGQSHSRKREVRCWRRKLVCSAMASRRQSPL
jgi:hypothetical protein